MPDQATAREVFDSYNDNNGNKGIPVSELAQALARVVDDDDNHAAGW